MAKEGLSQYGHFSDKGRAGQFFAILCGSPLWTAPNYSNYIFYKILIFLITSGSFLCQKYFPSYSSIQIELYLFYKCSVAKKESDKSFIYLFICNFWFPAFICSHLFCGKLR